MKTDVVPDDDVAAMQTRRKHLLDPDQEGVRVHRSGKHHRSEDAGAAQGSNDRVIFTPSGNQFGDPFTARRPRLSTRLGEIYAAFVDEDQLAKRPPQHSPAEQLARSNHVRPTRLRGTEGFFFSVSPIRPNWRHIVVSLTATPLSSPSSSHRTLSVASGHWATMRRRRFSTGPFTSRSRPGAVPAFASPVRSTFNRSFRTELALTPSCSATISDDDSVSSAERILCRKSSDKGRMAHPYQVFSLMERRCSG